MLFYLQCFYKLIVYFKKITEITKIEKMEAVDDSCDLLVDQLGQIVFVS